MSKDANDPPHDVRTVSLPGPHPAVTPENERRRLTLDVLSERAAPVDLADLAAAIERRESDLDSASGADTKDVTVALHHVHLPKLEEADLLEYDAESRVIEPTNVPADVDGSDSATAAGGRSTADVDLGEPVLAYFEEAASETASIADLARHVATTLPDSTKWTDERIRIRLHHVVLPRMDGSDEIDYDPRTNTVRYHSELS